MCVWVSAGNFYFLLFFHFSFFFVNKPKKRKIFVGRRKNANLIYPSTHSYMQMDIKNFTNTTMGLIFFSFLFLLICYHNISVFLSSACFSCLICLDRKKILKKKFFLSLLLLLLSVSPVFQDTKTCTSTRVFLSLFNAIKKPCRNFPSYFYIVDTTKRRNINLILLLFMLFVCINVHGSEGTKMKGKSVCV